MDKVEHTAVLSDITDRHYWISLEESTKLEVPLPKSSPNQDEDVEEKLEQLSIGDSFYVVLQSRDGYGRAWLADSVTVDYSRNRRNPTVLTVGGSQEQGL